MTMNTTNFRFLILAACAAIPFPVVAQDSLQLKDGRFVLDKKMTKDATGVMVHFDNGDIHIKSEWIRSTTARTAGGVADESLSDEDKAKLARGLVPYKGRWIRQSARDQAVARERDKRKARIAEALKHRKWQERHKLTTRNFEFEYTIDPEVMKEYADLMETYYKVFTKEWKIRKPRGMGKLKVCFYHDREYYQQVSGAQPGVVGYFRFVKPIELNFFYDRVDEEMTVDVMFHETNHYLTHLIDPNFKYPSWVNESLAEYYGASEWDPKKKKMTIGGIQEGRLADVQDSIKANRVSSAGTAAGGKEGEWQSLEALIRLQHGQFGPTHYAWGWTFVHFLLSNSKYASKFKKYYKALAEDKRIKKVLARGGYAMKTVDPDEQIKWLKIFLGVDDLKTLETEWHDYVRTLSQATHRGYHQAGQIAYMRGMPIKAQRLYQTSIDMGSENPMTHFGLGRARYDKRKYTEALQAFDKAIEMDPLNAVFYVWKAKCLVQGGKDESDPEVKRLKKLALEVEPDNYSVMLELAWDETLKNE